MDMQPGASVGAYRLLFPMKQTEGSEVWAARSSNTEVGPVALKLLRGFSAEDPAIASLDEARAASALQHEGLVPTIELERNDEGSVVVTSKLIAGPSLAALMQRLAREGRPLSAAVVAHLGIKISAALEYASSSASLDGLAIQLVHRHVSPHNILIERSGQVRLADLGIVPTDVVELPADSGTVRGKVNYMAPEQLSGGRVDPRTDIFSLGVVLYECSSGQSLFGRNNVPQSLNAVLNQAPQPLPDLVPGYPPALWEVINKCLAKEPELRFQNAGELRGALEAILEQVAGHAHAADALGQFVTSLFPPDSFDAKTPVPDELAGPAPRGASHAWPTVTSSDPLSGNVQPRAPRRSSSVAAPPSDVSLGSAGVPNSSSTPIRSVSVITHSGPIHDPYFDNFEPLLSDPRTGKYAAILALVLLLALVLVTSIGGPSQEHDDKIKSLVEQGYYDKAEKYFVEHMNEFKYPDTAYQLAAESKLRMAGENPDAPSQDSIDAEPSDGEPDEPSAAPPPPATAEPVELDPIPRAAPDLPGAGSSRTAKRASKSARRGQKQLAAGKLSRAERSFSACLKKKELPLCHRQLGFIYWKQDNRKGAVRHFERYLVLVPKADDAELIRAHVKQMMSLR